jgi:nitrate reductase assembly molybdenum cofactor insertion protein NarJ
MKNRFVLIKLLCDYRDSLNADHLSAAIKQQLINDLCTDRFELVHICEDTSASAALKEYVSASKTFSTFFLTGIELKEDSTCRGDVMVRVIERVNSAQQCQVIEESPTYRVFTSSLS